ncbi:MAG: InlB B-repeat-containing protein [Clostridiales bacterium]|nr:InlB B-repeat-containing protein [Clostridiales bacterium]
MKRKLSVILALAALILTLCCGAALADAPSFTCQPTVGDVSTDGLKLPVTWETDFVPVRTEIVQNGEVMETLAAGVTSHDFTESVDEYTVRVYPDESTWIESDPFRVDISVITFLLGHGSSQGPHYAYVRKGSSYALPKCMFSSPSDSGWLGHFVEWRVGLGRTPCPVGTVITVSQDMEVAAYWETGYYTIIFHAPVSGIYPEACAEDIDPLTGLLAYKWPYLNYASYQGGTVIRPLMGQLPDWSGYGPAPVHLWWELTETLDENYREPVWAPTSPNHGYTAYSRSVPKVYGFMPSSLGYVTQVEAWPVFGRRGHADYDANGGTGSMQSDVIEVPLGETGTYTVRQNSFTAPSAPSWYRFDGWLLGGETCAAGTVMDVTGADLSFAARWKDQYNDPGFYLYGILDGTAYACSESAESLGDLFTQTGDDVWTARVSSENGCHVSVKYYNGYYNETLWYHAAGSGGTAVLTPASAAGSTADMLEIPAGSFLVILEANGAGGYTLRYEETAPLCTITGDLTGWDHVEMTLNSDGTYTFSAEIDPAVSWSGTFEFFLTLNDVDYTASATVFDTAQELPLAPMDSEENSRCIRLASSGCAVYTFVFSPQDKTLCVTSDLAAPGAFLMGFMGDYPIRMVDPSSGEVSMGEGGGSEPPVRPWQFPGGTTLWASALVSGGEWLEEGPTFYIGSSGQTWGTDSVTVDTVMTLQQGGRCPIWVDGDFDGAEFDFYYCPETHQLMIQRHISFHQLTLYTWNAAEEKPMSEVTDYYEGDTDAFTIAPESAVHYREDWDETPFVLDGDTIVITAPDYPGFHVAAWYPCSVSMWWSSGSTGFELSLYGEEPSLGSGNTLTYPIENVYGDIQLTAVYESGGAEAVSIAFDTLGGVPGPGVQTLLSGGTATEPEAPMKIGAVFTGWYTDAACAADALFSFSTPVTADVTLYAGWQIPEPNGFLKLPAMLTDIGDQAFSGIAAEAVLIPRTVTSVSGNPFAGSSVRYVYGFIGSAAETFAVAADGLAFVPVDDAWLAAHMEEGDTP